MGVGRSRSSIGHARSGSGSRVSDGEFDSPPSPPPSSRQTRRARALLHMTAHVATESRRVTLTDEPEPRPFLLPARARSSCSPGRRRRAGTSGVPVCAIRSIIENPGFRDRWHWQGHGGHAFMSLQAPAPSPSTTSPHERGKRVCGATEHAGRALARAAGGSDGKDGRDRGSPRHEGRGFPVREGAHRGPGRGHACRRLRGDGPAGIRTGRHSRGGRLRPVPERCLAAACAGIRAVLVPGCVDMANFGGMETVPEKYHDRTLYKWNPNITLLRTNVEENRWMGEKIAAAANAATAPIAVLLPLKGVSMLDSEGHEFWDPEADGACFDAIRSGLKPGIPLIEVDANINDPEFSGKVAETLLEMLAGR